MFLYLFGRIKAFNHEVGVASFRYRARVSRWRSCRWALMPISGDPLNCSGSHCAKAHQFQHLRQDTSITEELLLWLSTTTISSLRWHHLYNTPFPIKKQGSLPFAKVEVQNMIRVSRLLKPKELASRGAAKTQLHQPLQDKACSDYLAKKWQRLMRSSIIYGTVILYLILLVRSTIIP